LRNCTTNHGAKYITNKDKYKGKGKEKGIKIPQLITGFHTTLLQVKQIIKIYLQN